MSNSLQLSTETDGHSRERKTTIVINGTELVIKACQGVTYFQTPSPKVLFQGREVGGVLGHWGDFNFFLMIRDEEAKELLGAGIFDLPAIYKPAVLNVFRSTTFDIADQDRVTHAGADDAEFLDDQNMVTFSPAAMPNDSKLDNIEATSRIGAL